MLSTVLWLIFTLAWCLSVVWWKLYGSPERRRLQKLALSIPGPPAYPIIGNALIFLASSEDLLTVLISLIKNYGEYIRIWLGPHLMVVVKNPADVRLLLTSNKLDSKGPLYEFMKPFVGTGLLSEGGPIWRSHRKIATPAYSKKNVQSFADVFNESAVELADTLCKKDSTVTFNVYLDVVQTTTTSVCQTVLGLTKEESKNIKSMDIIVKETFELYDFLFTSMVRWWHHIPLVYWLSGRKATERRYVKLMDEMCSDILEIRKKSLQKEFPKELSVVDRFILSGELTDQEIKWEIMTLFTASQEASAKIASTLLLILAHLPEWQDKVYKEIMEHLGAKDSFVSDYDWKNLNHLDMVYKEAVRWTPIGAFIERTVEEDITIKDGQITLPAGVGLTIPIHAMHRDPMYWSEPDIVDPSRFSPEKAHLRDPNAYVPFSLGAMDCIGRVFAESMIKILVIRLLRRVRLEAEGRMEDLGLNVAVSVRVARGYNLRAKPRRRDIANGVKLMGCLPTHHLEKFLKEDFWPQGVVAFWEFRGRLPADTAHTSPTLRVT